MLLHACIMLLYAGIMLLDAGIMLLDAAGLLYIVRNAHTPPPSGCVTLTGTAGHLLTRRLF